MQARLLHLSLKTTEELRRLRKEAEADGAYRVAKRLHAVLLNHHGYTSGEIAGLLEAPRSKVSQWLSDYEQLGYEALLEGQRSGRPAQLNPAQRKELEDILDSGPQAYGFLSGVWSAPMITRLVADEFGIAYTDRHVRRLLHRMGFSVQRPKRVLARANPLEQNRWRRYIYPNLKKRRGRTRPNNFCRRGQLPPQDSILYRTWARVGQQPVVPVTGERHAVKIFGCLEIYSAQFLYRWDRVFSGETYLDYLDGTVAPRCYRSG